MSRKQPTKRGMAGMAADPALPRLCVAPWGTDEERAAAEELCPEGCVPGGCVLAVRLEPKWPATRWNRPLTNREKGALRRSVIGCWTDEDRRVVEGLCIECRACGCSMDMDQLVLQHRTRDVLACPGFCLMAPPRAFRGRWS